MDLVKVEPAPKDSRVVETRRAPEIGVSAGAATRWSPSGRREFRLSFALEGYTPLVFERVRKRLIRQGLREGQNQECGSCCKCWGYRRSSFENFEVWRAVAGIGG